jgi:hypothetical protein
MKTYLTGVTAAVGALVLAACSSAPPPSAKAAGVERLQCDSASASQDDLVRSTHVLAVEPLYSHVITSNNNSEERVAGAKLLVRPPNGVTADQLTRVLQCHSARVLLGQVSSAATPNDPYWLPDTWVNINVKPENGNFAITITADSVHDNLAVFGRANHYADDHMVATDPGLP